MITIEIYRIDPTDGSFALVDAFQNFKGLEFFDKLNGIGSCFFTLNIWDSKASLSTLRRYRNQVVVKLEDTVIWAGPITQIQKSFQGEAGDIQVQAISYLGHLLDRYTYNITTSDGVTIDNLLTFTGVDAGNIAWNLIDGTQNQTNGNLGITQGTITSTVTRDRTYEFKNIAEAIIELTQVRNGFDFELAYAQDSAGLFTGVLFNVYQQRGTIRNDLAPVQLGNNIIRVQYATQDNIYNTITALGAGFGEGVLTSTQSDTTSQQDFTRRELVLPAKDISILSTLEESAQGELDKGISEQYHMEVTLKPTGNLQWGDFVVGDTLNIDLDNGSFIDFKGTGRIIERALSVNENGVMFISPKFSIVV